MPDALVQIAIVNWRPRFTSRASHSSIEMGTSATGKLEELLRNVIRVNAAYSR